MSKIFIFYNPGAGVSRKIKFNEIVQQWCSKNDWDAEIYATSEGEDLQEVACTKLGKGSWDAVGVAGGDGTVSLVVSALVKERCKLPLLIIPTGSGNLLAKNFYYPMDIRKCLDLLISGSENRAIDLMKVNDSYRILNAGVGFNSRLMQQTTRDDKRRLGILAYFKNIWNSVRRTRQTMFTLEIDGVTNVIRGADVFVPNAGLGLHIRQEDEYLNPSDGVVSVFVTKPSTFSGLFEIIGNVLKGRKRGIEVISRFEFRRELIVRTDRIMLTQSDGEVIGYSPLKIKLIPSAIHLIIPVRINLFAGLPAINNLFDAAKHSES